MKLFVSVLILGMSLSCATAQEKLAPKISKEQATKTALAQFKNGVVKDSELEKEDGRVVWSFDIQVGKERKEVWVDANSGKIVRTETETAQKESVEQAIANAEKIALKRVPGEVVKSASKVTKGKKIYCIEIRQKNGTITEVDIDGRTQKVVKTQNKASKSR